MACSSENEDAPSVFDDIADAPDGVDVLLAEALVNLRAQVADVDVDDVRIARIVVAPDLLENLVARQDVALVAQEILKELSRYNVEFLAFDAWKSNVVIEAFKAAGIDCRPIKQYYQQLSPACSMLSELIDKAEITHDGNPCKIGRAHV